jgi:hypothetical protein
VPGGALRQRLDALLEMAPADLPLDQLAEHRITRC